MDSIIEVKLSIVLIAMDAQVKIFCNVFFNTIFVSSHMYPENPEGAQVILGSMNMGYDIVVCLQYREQTRVVQAQSSTVADEIPPNATS